MIIVSENRQFSAHYHRDFKEGVMVFVLFIWFLRFES